MVKCAHSFTRLQWMVAMILSVGNFFNGMVFSLQAPFYPHEAEKKGLTAFEYGLVIGIFELVVFIVSPIIGGNLNRLQMKRTLTISMVIEGISSAIFGTLDKIDDTKLFLFLSIVLRIIEAFGYAGVIISSCSFIPKVFPNSTSTMYGILETFFGLGMVLGPFFGGLLYENGGFTLPFVTLGALLALTSIFMWFVLPNVEDTEISEDKKHTMKKVLKIMAILVSIFGVVCASGAYGFLQTGLEPHLRRMNMSPINISLIWVLLGAFYGLASPLGGLICDRFSSSAVAIVGALLMILSFTIIGPLPFLPITMSTSLVILSIIFIGISIAFEFVSGFSCACKQATIHGLPDSVETYGAISGLWASAVALGGFIGPTVAGIFSDLVGFQWSTLVVIFSQIVVLVLLVIIAVKEAIRLKNVNSDNLNEYSCLKNNIKRSDSTNYEDN